MEEENEKGKTRRERKSKGKKGKKRKKWKGMKKDGRREINAISKGCSVESQRAKRVRR